MSIREKAADAMRDAADVVEGKGHPTFHELQIKLEAYRGRMFGFGRRIPVPADQVHVVTNAGKHVLFGLKPETQVFGSARNSAGTYWWRNALSTVIPLATGTFIVPVSGESSMGVLLYDKEGTEFSAVAHVVAALDTDNAELAAIKVGTRLHTLASTTEEVTQAKLYEGAAKLTLQEIMDNRQKLADYAKDAVTEKLAEMGYKVTLLTIERIGEYAFDQYVEQAKASVTAETTREINEDNLKTHESENLRKRTEAEVEAETRRLTEERRLGADKEIHKAQIATDESKAERDHSLSLANEQRSLALSEEQHNVAKRKIQLAEQESVAETEKDANIEALRKKRQQEIALAQTEADAKRLAEEQERKLERELAKTEADAERLEREKLAEAERERKVKKTQAEADAEALQLTTEAQTQAELLKAQRAAEAAEKQAEADQKLAVATRAREAAPGLAKADVEGRMVEIAGDQVKVDRDKGLAEAEIEKQKAEAKIRLEQGLVQVQLDAERERAELYEKNPTLAEIEMATRQFDHEQRLAQIRAEAQIEVMKVLAPNINLEFKIFGSGTGFDEVMAKIMSLSYGAGYLGEQVPTIGRMIDNIGKNGNESEQSFSIPKSLTQVIPAIRETAKQINPQILSTLTVSQMIDRVLPALSGQADLVETIKGLKEDTHFEMFANVPVSKVLSLFGIGVEANDDSQAAKAVATEKSE